MSSSAVIRYKLVEFPAAQSEARIEGCALALAFALCLSAIAAFGATPVYAWSLIAGVAFIALAFLLAVQAAGRATIPAHPIFVPVLAFAGIVAAQLLLRDTANLAATRAGIVQLAACGAVLYAAFMGLQTVSNRRLAAFILWAFTGALACESLLQHFTANGRIYWFRDATYGTPMGPFVYHNHFAACILLLLPIAIWFSFDRKGGLANRLAFGIVPALALAALVLSYSRSGFIALLIELAIATALFGRRLWRNSAAAALVVVALLFTTVAGWTRLFARLGRLQHDASSADRLRVALACLHIWRDHPWFGAGFNTFRWIYPRYQLADNGQVWQFAHNDYAQLLAETGIAGAACALAFVVVLFISIRRLTRQAARPASFGLRKASRTDARLRLAAAVAIGGLLAQAVMDFPFHAPAIVMLFLLMVALVTAGADREARSPDDGVGAVPNAAPKAIEARPARSARALRVAVAAGLPICFLLAIAAARIWMSDRHTRRATALLDAGVSIGFTPPERTPVAHELSAAVRWQPDNGETWLKQAQFLSLYDPKAALPSAITAARLDPYDWRAWTMLGQLKLATGDPAGARVAMLTAVRVNSGFDAHFQTGSLALLQGDTPEFWRQMRAALHAIAPNLLEGNAAGDVAAAMDEAIAVAAGNDQQLAAIVPTDHSDVAAAAVLDLVNRGALSAAGAVWAKVPCDPNNLEICRRTNLRLSDALLTSAMNSSGPATLRLQRAALAAWNSNADLRLLPPAAVSAVTDPTFHAMDAQAGFAWLIRAPDLVETGPLSSGDSGLTIRFDGNEPDQVTLFEQRIAVVPGQAYEFSCRSRYPNADTPAAGIYTDIIAAGQQIAEIPATLAANWTANRARFQVPPGVALVTLSLAYRRPLGDVRISGNVELDAPALAMLPSVRTNGAPY
jgi:O-antigen ligase